MNASQLRATGELAATLKDGGGSLRLPLGKTLIVEHKTSSEDIMANTHCIAPPPPSPITECSSCRGSGVAQYLLDDSGCPCGPTYPCDACSGTGEQCDYSALVWGPEVHDTMPAPPPDDCEVA